MYNEHRCGLGLCEATALKACRALIMSLILLWLTIAFYSVGLLHSFLTIITRKKTLFRIALLGIGSGFVAHALSILLQWHEGGHPPITNWPEALSFFAFVIVLAFLLTYARYRLD